MSKNITGRVREGIRKRLVSLKRKPHMIPLAVLLAAFLLFSLSLTSMSDTTAKIQGKGMGLSQFTVMLMSILSMVCLLNAFPRRKKPNLPMLVLTLVMMGLIVFCDIYYLNRISIALTRAENPISLSETTMYIARAGEMLRLHTVLTALAVLLVVTLPLYSKLLRKINTSVELEESADIQSIDLSDLS